MTYDQEMVLRIKDEISKLPAAQFEACEELVEHIRQACRVAGEPVGTLALALAGAELLTEHKS